MSATLVYVGIGAALATGMGIFAIAILFLQTARPYVDLTEKRLELLREGEAFLLKIVQRQGRALEESLKREAEQREGDPEMVGYVIGHQQGEEPQAAARPNTRVRREEHAKSAGLPRMKKRRSGRRRQAKRHRGKRTMRCVLGCRCRTRTTTCQDAAGTSPPSGSSRSATTGTWSTTRVTCASPSVST